MFFKSYRSKRFFAYFLDFALVTIVISMISQLSYVNWNYDEYREVATEYTELVTNAEDLTELQNSNEYKKVTYDLSKYGQVYVIIEIIVYVGYFVFFQKYAGGQTLGKRIMKLKVVNENKKDVNLLSLGLRTLLIYSIPLNLSMLILINTVGLNVYGTTVAIIANVMYLINFIVCAFILFRKDNKGLHDLAFKTEVIEI